MNITNFKTEDDERTDDESVSSEQSSSYNQGFILDNSEGLNQQHNDYSATATDQHVIVQAAAETTNDMYNSHFGLQEKIFEGFLVCFSQALLDPHLEDLKFKIISNGGQFFDTPNEKVNILITPNSNNHDKERINHALKYHLPIVYEHYVTDCISVGTRLDWSQYCIPSDQDEKPNLPNSGTTVSEHFHQQQHNPHAPTFNVRLFVKGSRHTTFTEEFPEVLYTLTWKHKYDVRIVCSEKIFAGKNQVKIMEGIDMFLVMGYNDRIPVFPEDPTSPVADGKTSSKKKKATVSKKKGSSQPKKSEDKSTINISSLHRSSDEEIVIRFGINSLYCSKRFQYMPFRLCVKYTPTDSSDDYHFTIFSAEFKTFVKKDANISKYLNQPMPLNPTVKVVTKACTTTTKVDYSKFTTGCTSPKQQTGKKTKKGSTTKKRKKETQPEEGEMINQYAPNPYIDPNANPWPMNDMNMMYNPFLPMFPNHMPQMYSSHDPNAQLYPMSSGMSWLGEPVGLNDNGDYFYAHLLKDGIVYRVNDIVFVSPEDCDSEDRQDKDEALDERKDIEKYWVCKIVNFVQTKNDEMRFVGQWYYRWSDLQGFGCNIEEATNQSKCRKHHDYPCEKEIFLTHEDMHYGPLVSIKGKCQAKFMDPDIQLDIEEKKWLEKDNHFFFQCGFNRNKIEMFGLQAHEQQPSIHTVHHHHQPMTPLGYHGMQPMPVADMSNAMSQMGQMPHPSSLNPGLFPGMTPLPSNPFAPWTPSPFPSFPTSSLEPPLKKSNVGSSSDR